VIIQHDWQKFNHFDLHFLLQMPFFNLEILGLAEIAINTEGLVVYCDNFRHSK
jgi:hypothetical protein